MKKIERTFNIVRRVNVDDDTLKKIAEALGIPAAEHGRIRSVSGEIHIDPEPTPAGGGTPSQGGGSGSSSGGGTPPSGTIGGGRQPG